MGTLLFLVWRYLIHNYKLQIRAFAVLNVVIIEQNPRINLLLHKSTHQNV